MPNLTVLVDAFDYPTALPDAGAGTNYPATGQSILTVNGGNILDANVQMCYRTRQYLLEPLIEVSGSAHRDIGSGGDTTHQEWTWSTTITYSPTLVAYLKDNTTPTTEQDFVTFVDRATNGRKGWMYKGQVDDSPPPLIGSIDWTFHELVTIGGVPQTPTDATATEGVRLDSFEVQWADGDTGAGVAPVMVGNIFQGSFVALFNVSIGVPDTFASAWAIAGGAIQGGRPTAYTTAGEIDMVMTRKTLIMPLTFSSNITPNTDVVFDSDNQRADFTATPTLDFAWS